MFERYTEKARRVIFFARYEASQYGSRSIETEHLLLGLLREDRALRQRLLPRPGAAESIRKVIESKITRGERISTSIEMPISGECKQALHFAAEEAERLGRSHIGTEHIIVGLLQVEKSMAATILAACEVTLSGFREFLASEAALGPPTARSTGASHVAAQGTSILLSFLEAMRAGLKEESQQFFAVNARYIDERGRCWAGEEELFSQLGELFAPFAARNAKYKIEEAMRPCEGMYVASLLWEDVPFPEKAPMGLCWMMVTLGREELPASGWAIYSIQVTPVTRV
jgi:hypothetical protein